MNIIGSETIQSKEKFTVSLAAGVFTVTAHSSVMMDSITAGQRVELFISGMTYAFNDDSHASSNLTNLAFGIDKTVDWAEDVPFFIYLVNKNDTPDGSGIFISRCPSYQKMPANDWISDKTAAAVNDYDIAIFGAWVHDGIGSKPCKLLGCIRMRWSTATDDWTIQALISAYDGIGEECLQRAFTKAWDFPPLQNNALSTYFTRVNAPTWATPASILYYYTINREGYVRIYLSTENAGACTNGSDGLTIGIALPIQGVSDLMIQLGFITLAGVAGVVSGRCAVSCSFYDATLTQIVDNAFSNAGDGIIIMAEYKAFQLI